MIYDCVIIGGGLAGLTCGIKCAKEGLHTVIISGGMNSLHFSSGSIDLAGYTEKGAIVKKPFEYIKELIKSNKEHPYTKIGLSSIKKSIDFFVDELASDNIPLNNNGEYNHFRVTPLGAVKPTYLSQESVYSSKGKEIIKSKGKIAILNFKGFRDYYAEQTAANIKNHPIFQDIEITVGSISLPYYHKTEKNLHEFRSIDISRIFETEKYLPRIAEEIKRAAGDAVAISLPAFIGIKNYKNIRQKLEAMTGKFIYEIPTLPPSILGLRIDHALKDRFFSYGGEYIAGEKIVSGKINKNEVESISTLNEGRLSEIKSKYYVLATGSFFSGGLQSRLEGISETIFDLATNGTNPRNKWYSKNFFDKKSHPFLNFGVVTDKNLNAKTKEGKAIKNLLCAGAIIGGYNPIKEGCGGGVAIASAYKCAELIAKDLKK
ncbi:MAG TPA: glycerol-3-phosphate dehydrogenase subunit GlpB [Spirochaetota bacterium]|nr:glycerol-3-phosphate dehydrogenase subunit GlpB [Spirochaetota bacterium]HPP95618.1 glycerol-3-phosphate dehydrogenase subunit GlpB [Spirochaetota bacterium]